MARVVTQLEERARQEQVTISSAIEPGLYVASDPLALDLVVRNILENAVTAVQSAGGGRIELTAHAASGEVELSVKDSGVGFPPADGARLFERFTRLHPDRRTLRYRARSVHRATADGARAWPGARLERRRRQGRELRAHLAGGGAGAAAVSAWRSAARAGGGG